MATKLEQLREILQGKDLRKYVNDEFGYLCTSCDVGLWGGLWEGAELHEVDCEWPRIDAILAEPEGPLCTCGKEDHYGSCSTAKEECPWVYTTFGWQKSNHPKTCPGCGNED